MKKLMVLMVLAMFVFASVGYAEEIFKPGQAKTGQIGTSAYPWRLGTFQSLKLGAKTVASTDIVAMSMVSHDYVYGSTDWTLSYTEKSSPILIATKCTGTCSIIAPAENRMFLVINTNATSDVVVKKSGGSGATVAAGYNSMVVAYVSNDYIKITAAASYY